jgi:hypothetical protein
MARSIKDDAHRLIDQLPESSGWYDLMEQIWIRQSIEAGMADSEARRTRSVEDIRDDYGLPAE